MVDDCSVWGRQQTTPNLFMRGIMEKKTLGQEFREKLIEKPNAPITLEEAQHHFREDYFRNLMIAQEEGKKIWPGQNFYVMALTRVMKLVKDMPRIQWYKVHDCPQPSFSQSVFKYHAMSNTIDELWTLPTEERAKEMHYVISDIAPEERDRYKYVRDYYDGTLWKLCKYLNNEQADTNLLQGRTIISEKDARIVDDLIQVRKEFYERSGT